MLKNNMNELDKMNSDIVKELQKISNPSKYLFIEPFDGVRKSNARKIFGILLIIIVIDFGIDLIV